MAQRLIAVEGARRLRRGQHLDVINGSVSRPIGARSTIRARSAIPKRRSDDFGRQLPRSAVPVTVEPSAYDTEKALQQPREARAEQAIVAVRAMPRPRM